ncbi:MAG: hypothetical protein J6T01_07065, partial [Kiritimatiellae bacterium]|nr:hypothetical protein [Kiritimatiellia bacterium]
ATPPAVTNSAATPPAVTKSVAAATNLAAAVTNAPSRLKIRTFHYDRSRELRIAFTERPDMSVVRDYITFEPLPAGDLKISTEYQAVSGGRGYAGGWPQLVIEGDFAFRTNITFKVRKGLPAAGGRSAETALEEDYVRVITRDVPGPSVGFAAGGRYLTPAGGREIAVEMVNVGSLRTEICRIAPQNVVQMLAREEGAYRVYSWRSGESAPDGAELAGEREVRVLACRNTPNVQESTAVKVAMSDGGVSNGIFMVSISDADHPDDGTCTRHRVVCVSDLGLSVRPLGKDSVGVWVASLASGRPVAKASVEVYSSANIQVMRGETDANGWCKAVRTAKGLPFAVVVTSRDRDDMTFLAMRDSMEVDETRPDGCRPNYVGEGGAEAFVWTDRGIYRHGEKIRLGALLRGADRAAPRPFPVELSLRNPAGDVVQRKTAMPDAAGGLFWDGFSAAAEQPGGKWNLEVRTPGRAGELLGETEVKVEEFAPPQIRVKVDPLPGATLREFSYKVSAEHLFGGAARNLRCEGAVVFEDEAFAPDGWRGWRFGDETLGLKPRFTRLKGGLLGRDGAFTIAAHMPDDVGRPKAAVRVTVQGVVFEDGGRPATARKSVVRHYHPYYIGSRLPDSVDGVSPETVVACVLPDGSRFAGTRRLAVKIERIDTVYNYRRRTAGWSSWEREKVRSTVVDGVSVSTASNGEAVVKMPLKRGGEYALTVADAEAGVSFSRSFYYRGGDDDAVRAPMSNPVEVALTPDKAFYRPGERPRIAVKSPFPGFALLTVLRDDLRHAEVVRLTNATAEVTLPPVDASSAPNLDVYLSVLRGMTEPGAEYFAVRACGLTTVAVRPPEEEIPVSLKVDVALCETGSLVTVEASAPGGEFVSISAVDEAIHLLTGGDAPDPVGFFASPRGASHPLYDIYHRLLPVDALPGTGGRKAGGGFGADLLGRISPVPTRRFTPLAIWRAKTPVSNGVAKVRFTLPEFAGEVRFTAVAYGAGSSGAALVRRKVSPKLVILPDAPRFAAPGDEFEVSMPTYNRSGEDGAVAFEISAGGAAVRRGEFALAAGAATNVVLRLAAAGPGEMPIVFNAAGFGEKHVRTIALPVRPAAAWRESAGVKKLAPGEKFIPEKGRFTYREFDSPLAELSSALAWLSDYPHGCLEQTASRIFPLIAGGGILNTAGLTVEDRREYVSAGVKRVESMSRANGFVMWPDCDYRPWDEDVSIYAAHFLVEAGAVGIPLDLNVKKRVLGYLKRCAMSTNDEVSVYACHVLARAGRPEQDRMNWLFDERARLSPLSRARLAGAFAAVRDRPRAVKLLETAAAPDSVKEAAFSLTALLETCPGDARSESILAYLNSKRDRAGYSWGTTAENAHALVAIGTYYRHHPPKKGERLVAWRKLELPRPDEIKAERRGIAVERRFFTAEGAPVDMSALKRGDMLIVELAVSSESDRTLNDLVVEDLFPGCFEPVHGEGEACGGDRRWVMRSDARDDRMLVFSKRFTLRRGEEAKFRYPVRVVSAGDYTLPGVSVNAMYAPSLRANTAPSRIRVHGL